MPRACPCEERTTDELRPIACPDGVRIATEEADLIEQSRDVLAGHAEVRADEYRLVADAAIGQGEAFEPPAVGQLVADKIHAPYFVELRSRPTDSPCSR